MPMAALGPKARALLDAGRSAYRPQADDRARIAEALRARLGAQALPAQLAPATVANVSTWSILGGAAAGVCMGASIAWWALSSPHAPVQPKPAPSDPAVLAAQVLDRPPPQPSIQPARVPAPEVQASPPVAASKHARTSPPGRPDSLAREITLLTRATRELAAGHAQRALSALAQHQRMYPNGKLSEERRAARAQALCALGRVQEGLAEQARLTPQSPAAARARQACDADPRADPR